MLAVRLPSAVAALLLSLAGCAFMHDPSRMPGPWRDPMAPIYVTALGDEVCAMRDLPLRHALDVRALSDDNFAFRFFALRDRSGPDRTEAEDWFWKGFGFAPPGVSGGDETRRFMASGVFGLYDPRTKKLYVRGARGDGKWVEPSGPGDRYVLVHEIEHALQDQNFGLDDAASPSDDETLARRALLEGDARLTEIGAVAREVAGDDLWVRHATYWLRVVTIADILRNEGVEEDTLHEAPPLVRRSVMFPYVEGAAFVGDLVRAGGLSLVDQAFAHPPRSTEQVLHPQKYADGELPVPVDAPGAPDGWRRVASGSMGELTMAVLLAQCEPKRQADADVTGWGGDAWAMVARPNEGALLWSTVWDDEASAARFERAAGARAACLAKATIDPRAGREVLVVRDGKRVAYVQGLTAELREPMARTLLGLPKDPLPAAPPFERTSIRLLVDPYRSFAHQGEWENGTWTSEPLGMTIRVPAGFKPVDPGANEATMRDASSGSFAEFHVVFQPATDTLRQAIVRQIVSGARHSMLMRAGLLTYTGDDETQRPDGTAHDYHWQWTAGGRLDVRFLPACGGKGAVVVVTGWNSYTGQVATDRWLGAFRLPDPASAACTWLRDAPAE